jgi:ubiquinone/menaquinone biosynthesis C-methylase UbiE
MELAFQRYIYYNVYTIGAKMEADAKSYEEVSGPQIEAGSRFIDGLNLSLGDKVLDIGCGTGHLTKYIAEIVGPEGQAVGIDPDAERIKIAQEKSKEVSNLQFHVGSSVTGFPRDNEPYYDVHISTHAFHWVPDDEKIIYIQQAYQCLKPGGRLAIWCVAGSQSGNKAAKVGFHSLPQEGYRDLFQKVALFENVVVQQPLYGYRYKSFEEFKRWFKATSHREPEDHPRFIEKFVTVDDNGQVTCKVACISITANKN